MPTNIDYREIVQTVTQNVLHDVKQQLATMEPDIEVKMVKQIEASLRPTIDSFASQLSDIQWRLKQLEQSSSSQMMTSSPKAQPAKKACAKKACAISSPQPAKKTCAKKACATSLPQLLQKLAPKKHAIPQVNTSPIGSSFLSQIQGHCWPYIKHKEWIIYSDYSGSKEPYFYMMHEDETEKTKIPCNSAPYEFISVVENGSDWIIQFKDIDDLEEIIIVKMA